MEDLDQRTIGLELHQAETAIGIGRQAIRELVSSEPVDHAAIEAQRANVQEARLARNALREQLKTSKDNGPLGGYSWH